MCKSAFDFERISITHYHRFLLITRKKYQVMNKENNSRKEHAINICPQPKLKIADEGYQIVKSECEETDGECHRE